MLFWSFVILLVIGIVCVIIYNHTMVDDWCLGLGAALTIISSIVVAIMSGVIICHHTTVDGLIASDQERYKSLIYQYENSLYDNDNDIGKKELMDEIREWNEDLAYHQTVQKNFWVGIFIPDVYDQFEFIELK